MKKLSQKKQSDSRYRLSEIVRNTPKPDPLPYFPTIYYPDPIPISYYLPNPDGALAIQL